MGRSRQGMVRKAAPLGRRAVGLRLLAVAGLLLALDLFLLPWHDFGTGGVQGADPSVDQGADRTAVEDPNAALGIAAVVGGLGLAAYAGVHAARGLRGGDDSPAPADRVALFAGPAVLGLLALKLALEPERLGIGAWLGLLLGAAVAYGGFVMGQDALLAMGDRWRQGGGRRSSRGLTQQQKWLLLGTAVVVAAIVAIALPDDDPDEVLAPAVPETSVEVTDPVPGETFLPAEPPSSVVGEEMAETTVAGEQQPPGPGSAPPLAGGRGTTVEPTTAESGGGVTVSGRGATPGESYVVRLSRDPNRCATTGIPLGAARVAEADGTVPEGRAFIPTNTTSGTYYVCLANAVDPPGSLSPAMLVVT